MTAQTAAARLVTILTTILITCLIIMALIVSAAEAEPPPPIVGPAQVIDGATLRVAGGRVRLHGIIPASPVELLPADAAFALFVMADKDLPVTCRPVAICADGAAAAICLSASGRDIGHALVGGGYARSDPAVALYDNAQDRAHALRLGLWRR